HCAFCTDRPDRGEDQHHQLPEGPVAVCQNAASGVMAVAAFGAPETIARAARSAAWPISPAVNPNSLSCAHRATVVVSMACRVECASAMLRLLFGPVMPGFLGAGRT